MTANRNNTIIALDIEARAFLEPHTKSVEKTLTETVMNKDERETNLNYNKLCLEFTTGD